jgi:hypothetical protein
MLYKPPDERNAMGEKRHGVSRMGTGGKNAVTNARKHRKLENQRARANRQRKIEAEQKQAES